MLDAFALLVLFVLVATAIWLFVIVGRIPGRIAREAEHPQAEAINLLGWFGLAAGGLGWVLALVWSKTRPAPDKLLEARVEALEARLAVVENTGETLREGSE
jgi:hypothetical protein